MKGGRGAIAPPLFGRIEGAALLLVLLLAPPTFRKPLTPLGSNSIFVLLVLSFSGDSRGNRDN